MDITAAQLLAVLERFGLPVAVLVWFMLRTDKRLDRVFEGNKKILDLVNTMIRLKCRPNARNSMESDSNEDIHG